MQSISTETPDAIRPSHLGWRIWWRVFRRVWEAADRLNLSLVAAGVAFYALVSIFPAIAALIAIWGYVADPIALQDQLGIAQRLLPDDAFAILQEQIAALIGANDSTLQLTSLLSVLLAIWTARNGVAALIRGLNSIYHESHRRNPFRRYIVAILLTVLLIFVAILAFAAVVILPGVLAYFSIRPEIEIAITLIKWLVLLSVVLLGIGVLYRFGPNRRGAKVSWLTPGAIFALLLWAGGSIAFSVYLRNFGNFNEVYGSIGAVIALLFWFYISSYVVLLGAQLNAELELATIHDTTVGEDRPAGERQAFVADNVADANGNIRPAEATPQDRDPQEN